MSDIDILSKVFGKSALEVFDQPVIRSFATREELDEKINEVIISGISEYVRKSHAKGVIVGISGGIDSAVVATLSVKALGDFWVKGVYMPCCSNLSVGYSEEEKQDEVDAFALADWLEIEIDKVDLTTSYTVLSNNINRVLGHAGGGSGEMSSMARANLKARLRMSTLYGMKEDLNYLCIGTGNKTEIMVGYLTKYGDGGVDFEPLGEYYKTEVKIMADILGIKDSVPNIVNKAPSARLTPGQTDEDDLGASYEDIDRALMDLEYGKRGPEERIKLKKQMAIKNVLSKHKRNAPPVILRNPVELPDKTIMRWRMANV